MGIGENIKQIRESRNLSTTKLAKMAGIAQSALREIELGNTTPTYKTIEKLEKALGMSLAEIQSYTEPPLEIFPITHLPTSMSNHELFDDINAMTMRLNELYAKILKLQADYTNMQKMESELSETYETLALKIKQLAKDNEKDRLKDTDAVDSA